MGAQLDTVVLSVRLRAQTKQRWEKYCKARGKGASTAIREAIERQLADTDEEGTARLFSTREIELHPGPKLRVEILLTKSEKDAIAERARAEGFSQRRWMIAALRSALTGAASIGIESLKAIGESNYQLLSIGRNLNQMAKKLNDNNFAPEYLPDIHALKEFITQHTEIVSDAIRSQTERWDLK